MEGTKFGMTEVFGWYDGTEATGKLIVCQLCASVVQYDNNAMEIHRSWHDSCRQTAYQAG